MACRWIARQPQPPSVRSQGAPKKTTCLCTKRLADVATEGVSRAREGPWLAFYAERKQRGPNLRCWQIATT